VHAVARGYSSILFHPDYTVGFGISPNLPKRLADYHRRWGITPRPENDQVLAIKRQAHKDNPYPTHLNLTKS